MKIAFIPSGNDPYNKHSWSGTDYYTRKALEDQGHEVYCIYGFTPVPSIALKLRKVIDKIRGFPLDARRTKESAKKYAHFIQNNITKDTDVIFALSTTKVAYLDTNIPIYIMLDSIFEMHRSFYGGSGTKRYNRDANEIELLALKKSNKIIPCSKETGEFIHNYYGIPDNKIKVVPLGANWDKAPNESYVIEQLNRRIQQNICRILFVGVDWKRKGADIVLNTIEELNKRKFAVELELVGLKDVPIKLPQNVHNHGFISKETPEGIKKLQELFSSAHFLFVPSIAEAYGLVFCEANAYAVPNISHRKGGLTTIVEDGINGQLFELGTCPEVFADYIMKTFSDKEYYKQLCINSLKRYQTMLNWLSSGKKLNQIIHQ